METDKKDKTGDIIEVVIETPKGSHNKYAYDPQTGFFKLKDNLPLGCCFPFDFGFIPGTKAEDGDPLDVMVLMAEPTFCGCLVECRLIGVIKAKQTEDGETFENDRLIAVSIQSLPFKDIHSLKELDKEFLEQIEDFFIFYAKQLGKKVKQKGIGGPKNAQRIAHANKT
jgi:inorganic pyrophosphatase